MKPPHRLLSDSACAHGQTAGPASLPALRHTIARAVSPRVAARAVALLRHSAMRQATVLGTTQIPAAISVGRCG